MSSYYVEGSPPPPENLTVGYTLPAHHAQNRTLHLRVYVTAENLFTCWAIRATPGSVVLEPPDSRTGLHQPPRARSHSSSFNQILKQRYEYENVLFESTEIHGCAPALHGDGGLHQFPLMRRPIRSFRATNFYTTAANGTGLHGRIRHTQRRCVREPATSPLGRHALPDDARRRDPLPTASKQRAPSDHRQLRLFEADLSRWHGSDSSSASTSQPHHPESAGHRHGPQTPHWIGQRSEAAARAFTGSIRRGSGAKCPCPIRRQLFGRGSANCSTRFMPEMRKTSTKPTRSFPTAIRT